MNDTERWDMRRFLNRLRILRNIDACKVEGIRDWPRFRDDPRTYLVQAEQADVDIIWDALREREGDR